MLPLYQLALGGLAVLVALRVANALTVWLRRRAFAARHGCRAPRVLSRWENLRTTAKAWKGRAWLPLWVHRYNTLGTTFASSSLGGTIIFTVAPENLKALLAADFKDFDLGDRRRHFFCPLVGNGIFTHDGAAWERSRGLIRPSFTKVYISDLALFEAHFQDLLAVLPPADAFSGLVDVDLQPLFFRLTMDSATEVLLGRSFRCLVAPAGSAPLRFLDSFDYAGTHIHNYGLRVQPALKPFAAVRDALFRRQKDPFLVACEDVHATMDQIIAEYLVKLDKKQLGQPDEEGVGEEDREKKKKYVFLEEIVKETRDPVELRWEVINVLAAGRDTTASLLSNAFFLLARHPDVFNRVHAEVREAFGDRLPDYESLRNLKQVRNLINECLRLYPPLPFNSRQATKDTILPRGGGPDGQSPVFVHKDQPVNYHIFALHRLKETFGPDAEEFNPDRWNNPDLRPGWGYIPFNGGPRICLGQQFALTEASYIIARMMQTIDSIERRDPVFEWKEHISLITRSRNGVKVAMKMTQKN